MSRCKRLQVGAVIIRPDMSEVLGIGYNGPSAGVDNESCRGGEGSCGCIHAEANALIKLRTGGNGLVLLSTDSPCEHCAGLILNTGGRIGAVVYGRAYRDRTGVDLLKRGGIAVVEGVELWGYMEKKNPV